MKKRRYSRNNDSLLVLAIRSQWQFSAFISAGIFIFALFILPVLGNGSVLIQTLIATFKPFILILGWIFTLIALINYFRQAKKSLNASIKSTPSVLRPVPSIRNTNVRPLREHPVAQDVSANGPQGGNPSNTGNPTPTQRPSSWSIELLQQIEWKLFEDVSAAYFKEKGIRAELTKLGADGGIDIKLFQDDSGNPTSLVQCKAWNTKLVGVKPIREFLGVMSHEKIPKGFFMASGSFSQDAIEIAKANRITLVNGNMFLAMIQRLPAEGQQRLLDLATDGDYTTPSCPSCGVKMLRRSSKRGDFWGCLNFPRCRQILHVKGTA